jgi:TonB family protein
MQVQAIRSFLAACVLVSALHAAPADETVLFANYNPGDQPSFKWGGWRIGATNLDENNYGGKRAIGILITPSSTGYLNQIEVVLHHEKGGHDVTGYLMTDASGPGEVLAKVSLSVQDAKQWQIVSAVTDARPLLQRSRQYWFVLESTDEVADSIFWPRREDQPATSVAFGTNGFTRWRVQPGTYGAMLRLYGEPSSTAGNPPQPEPTPPAAPLPVVPSSAAEPPGAAQSPGEAQSFPGSLVNQKLILRHAPAVVEMKLKTSQLASLAGECDLAVQVRKAKWSHGKLSLLLDTIGEPSPLHCRQISSPYELEVSGFKHDESSETVAASLRLVLQTPEEYLAAKGIMFNRPPGPDDESPVNAGAGVTPAKALLSVNSEFSDEARRAKFQGSVVVAFVVGTDGRIHQARVVRGGDMGLGEACLRVLPLWRFEPARQADKLVASQSHLEMTFHLY